MTFGPIYGALYYDAGKLTDKIRCDYFEAIRYSRRIPGTYPLLYPILPSFTSQISSRGLMVAEYMAY